MGEPALLDEVLVNAHGIPPELDLGLDPGPMRLAGRRRPPRPRWRRIARGCGVRGGPRSRWPEWGNLVRGPRRPGGRGGGVWAVGVAPDRLPIHPRPPGDLSVADPAGEQRLDRDAQMRLQDVHSGDPPKRVGEECTSRRWPPWAYLSPGGSRSGVGDFEVATGGGVWVAAGAPGSGQEQLRYDHASRAECPQLVRERREDARSRYRAPPLPEMGRDGAGAGPDPSPPARGLSGLPAQAYRLTRLAGPSIEHQPRSPSVLHQELASVASH